MTIHYSWQSTPQLWAAMRPDYDGALDSKDPIGFGKTKEEAAADLLDQEQDIADLKQWPVSECRCVWGMGGRCVHCDSRITNTNSYRVLYDAAGMNEEELIERLRCLADLQDPAKLGREKTRAWRVACKLAADLLALRAGPNRAENEIRADECRQIMVALDRYAPASDYGPPITERIALHERGATGGEG